VLLNYQPGDVVTINILRGNNEMTFQLKLGHFDGNGNFHPP